MHICTPHCRIPVMKVSYTSRSELSEYLSGEGSRQDSLVAKLESQMG